MMKKKKGDTARVDEERKAKIDAYLKEQTPADRKAVNRLRRIIRDAVPELVEQMRWVQIGYVIEKKDVCGIYVSSDHINISFMQGAALKDPKKLLEGTGKGMRHIKVYAVDDLDEEALKEYVREATSSIVGSQRNNSNFAYLLKKADTDGYRRFQ
jgi:hypothetical protein